MLAYDAVCVAKTTTLVLLETFVTIDEKSVSVLETDCRVTLTPFARNSGVIPAGERGRVVVLRELTIMFRLEEAGDEADDAQPAPCRSG